MQQPTRVSPTYPVYPQPVYARPSQVRRTPRGLVILLMLAALVAGTGLAGAAGLGLLVMSGRILPGVRAGGVALGGQSAAQATDTLRDQWRTLTVRGGAREWSIAAAELGLTLDAAATAQAAQGIGRGDSSLLRALTGQVESPLVLVVDSTALTQGIMKLAATVDQPAQNATIRMENGDLKAIPAVDGLTLDVPATLARLMRAAGDELTYGVLDLSMTAVRPTVPDAAPLLQRARTLLAAPLTLTIADPLSAQTVTWLIPNDQWGAWLTTENTASGVSFAVNEAALRDYLNAQTPALGEDRALDLKASLAAVNLGLAAGRTTTTLQVVYKPRSYRVSAGETVYSIAWKFGIPAWRIVNANPGLNINALSVGQTLTIPPKDANLEKPIIPNKRIVVSIAAQAMKVYENGALKWDWKASTGIADSPTMPGLYQILSHEKSAYAANWDLDMPYFMGIYDAVPGFTNGIHGMPTRGGYSILWENSLGTRITFGCILISNANARTLYAWAEEGVVIEVV